jgi:archaellum component FlaC
MALTQEDLLAIGNLLESKLAPIKTDVTDLKDDVGILKTDVAGLKDDVGELRSDVVILKGDVGTLKTDVTGLKDDVGELRSDVVILKDDVGSIKETVHRNYDVTLEFYGKQQEFNMATQEKLDELHSLIVIFSQQTIKNTTDLRLIK